MEINGKRIVLRSWRGEDAEALVEGLNNINVSKWLATVPYPYTKKDAEGFIAYAKQSEQSGKDIALAIVLKENNKVIGGTTIQNINKKDGTCTGGIWLNEKYQKNGYGTEAFSLRAEYCFNVLGLRRLENGYFAGNEKSKKMQEKLGYKNEGIRRKKYLCLATNEYVDECITGLLKDEFAKIEDENDLQCYYDAMEEFKKNPKTYTTDELKQMMQLWDEEDKKI